VPFGALYRIIDITLSNCINSNLRRVFILTQYKGPQLEPPHPRGWSPLAGLGDYIEVLPPQMRVSQQWYQGTADAVYQNIYSIGSERSKFVFILSGDHIYKMKLQPHAQAARRLRRRGHRRDHRNTSPPGCQAVGVIETDKDWRIIGFEEKPAVPKESPHTRGTAMLRWNLHLQYAPADSHPPRGLRGSQVQPRFWQRHSSAHHFEAPRLCLQLRR